MAARQSGRAWLIAATLALPVSAYFVVQAITSRSSMLSYVFAAVPLLLVARARTPAPYSWVLTGIVVALCIVGASGIGILLVPFAIATIVLELTDRRARVTLTRVVIIGVTFIVTMVAIVSAASAMYRRP